MPRLKGCMLMVLCLGLVGCSTARTAQRGGARHMNSDEPVLSVVAAATHYYEMAGQWPSSLKQLQTFAGSTQLTLNLDRIKTIQFTTQPDGLLRIAYELRGTRAGTGQVDVAVPSSLRPSGSLP